MVKGDEISDETGWRPKTGKRVGTMKGWGDERKGERREMEEVKFEEKVRSYI